MVIQHPLCEGLWEAWGHKWKRLSWSLGLIPSWKPQTLSAAIKDWSLQGGGYQSCCSPAFSSHDLAVTLGSVHIPWILLALVSWPHPLSAWPGSASLHVGLLYTPPDGWWSLDLNGWLTWNLLLLTLHITFAFRLLWSKSNFFGPVHGTHHPAHSHLSSGHWVGLLDGACWGSVLPSSFLLAPTLYAEIPALLEPLEMCKEGSGENLGRKWTHFFPCILLSQTVSSW